MIKWFNVHVHVVEASASFWELGQLMDVVNNRMLTQAAGRKSETGTNSCSSC